MGLLFCCQFWFILWLLKKKFCLFVLRFSFSFFIFLFLVFGFFIFYYFCVPFPVLLIILFLFIIIIIIICAHLPLACAPLKKIEVSIHNFLTKKMGYLLFYLMRI